MRDTKQRQAIMKVFEGDLNRLWSPQEVCDQAAKDVPNIGIATVYRNISAMVEDERLMTVSLPGMPDRYCRYRLEDPTRVQVATDTSRAWAFWQGDKSSRLDDAHEGEIFFEYGKEAPRHG